MKGLTVPMAYEQKMRENGDSVEEFIGQIDEKKREDAFRLLRLFEETSGYPAKMWGYGIIGFGRYHYKYASGHEGDAPLVAFSPRKDKISLYLLPESPEREELLAQFGKHKAGKGCIYINKLADVDTEVLKRLIRAAIEHMRKLYPESAG